MGDRGFPASRLSVAPMMECTDRNYRFLARLITQRTMLWTEMIVSDNLMVNHRNGNTAELKKVLDYSKEEHPLALQLGGSDPEILGKASELVSTWCQLSELNLNCGCPSERVGGANLSEAKQFGARLMHKPAVVKQCVAAMRRACGGGGVPVTVKCRLGTDEMGGYDRLKAFVSEVSEGGVERFVIHSRDCVLKGLTPLQNRNVPPLRPRWAHRLQADFPHLLFDINGGIKSLEMALTHLSPTSLGAGGGGGGVGGGGGHPGDAHVSFGEYGSLWVGEVAQSQSVAEEDSRWGDLPPVQGVMIGREAWNRPWVLSDADVRVFGEKQNNGRSRRHVLEEYVAYAERLQDEYVQEGRVHNIRQYIKPIFGLFALEQGGRNFRRQLELEWVGKGIVGRREPSLREMVDAACTRVPDEVLDRT